MKLSRLLWFSLIMWTNLDAMAAEDGPLPATSGIGVPAKHLLVKQDVSDILLSRIPLKDRTGDKKPSNLFNVDGFTIASDEHSWTAPLQNGMDALPTTPLRLDQSIPIAVSPMGPEARNFNASAKMLALQLWNDAGGPPPDAPLDDDDLDLSLSYALNSNSINNIISIKMLVDINNRAGARGS